MTHVLLRCLGICNRDASWRRQAVIAICEIWFASSVQSKRVCILFAIVNAVLCVIGPRADMCACVLQISVMATRALDIENVLNIDYTLYNIR